MRISVQFLDGSRGPVALASLACIDREWRLTTVAGDRHNGARIATGVEQVLGRSVAPIWPAT
jgi:hypothetical protein